MRMTQLRLSGFQSFGPDPTTIDLDSITYVIGPNGAGKTAALVALARMFSPNQYQRKVRPDDFHVPVGVVDAGEADSPVLWIEVDIEFEEASATDANHPTVPPFFEHMHLRQDDAPPFVRIRLTATKDFDGFIEERIEYVLEVGDDDEPTQASEMSRHDRALIEVHYLPARRDPSEQIAFTATSLLGRILRVADWSAQKEELEGLMEDVTASMAGNAAIKTIGTELERSWSTLHRGDFFREPSVSFGRSDIDGILKQLTLCFSPAHASESIDFGRLSDGQQSLLYISLVVAWLGVAKRILDGDDCVPDIDRLRPPVYAIVAVEEPENSLSPHYLGRIVRLVKDACADGRAQGIMATHSPSVMKRVPPEAVRYLRLSSDRTTLVQGICLPKEGSDAAKYVREAVQAFPEVYFSRLVVLGEGDSELIVLPRLLAAAGVAEDDASVTVAPLGGRHVHHFWRLLDSLSIPYVTLLDLDWGRHQAGWGRIGYAAKQLNKLSPGAVSDEKIKRLPAWDGDVALPTPGEQSWLTLLEKKGVFFSYPLDLDMMMTVAYPEAYGAEKTDVTDARVKSVFGGARPGQDQLPDELDYLGTYHRLFMIGSKPAAHLGAMSVLDDAELLKGLPSVLARLVDHVKARLKAIPE